jgi:succinate dehydrogenase hydrophobic anchor subunit
MQRVTAVVNVILLPWFVFLIMAMIHNLPGLNATTIPMGNHLALTAVPDHASLAASWLSSGLTPVLMILLVVSITYHAMLGITSGNRGLRAPRTGQMGCVVGR